MLEEERHATMAHHIHDVLDKFSHHITPKWLKKGTSRSAQSPIPEDKPKSTPREPRLTHPAPPSDFRPNDKYTNLKDLDAGDEGQCSVVRSQISGLVYVRKHTRAPSPEPARRPAHLSPPRSGKRKPLPPEARMLTHLQPRHPNIIRYFAVEASSHGVEQYNIYIELCSGGDLLDQLRTFRNQTDKPGPTAPVVLTLHVLVSLARALAYLHHGLRWREGTIYEQTKGWEAVIHGDIKPDNVFLRHTSRLQVTGLPDVVLGDFGMAHFASQSQGITGTPGYDSPEVRQVADLRDANPFAYEQRCRTRVMTTKSDIYQLGLILHLMATGRHHKIGGDPSDIELCEEYGGVRGFMPFLVWCLQPNYKDRPECTNDIVEGCIFAVDVLRKQRDVIVGKGEAAKLKGLWNIVQLDGKE